MGRWERVSEQGRYGTTTFRFRSMLYFEFANISGYWLMAVSSGNPSKMSYFSPIAQSILKRLIDVNPHFII